MKNLTHNVKSKKNKEITLAVNFYFTFFLYFLIYKYALILLFFFYIIGARD